MQIHVVGQNQTLTTIAQTYGTTVNDLIKANEVPNPNNLVIGQTLVIPIVGSFYWVQPGDNLWAIANRFQTNYQELATVNGISPNQPLMIGQRLYIPPQPKTDREFNAYVEPRGTTVAAA